MTFYFSDKPETVKRLALSLKSSDIARLDRLARRSRMTKSQYISMLIREIEEGGYDFSLSKKL